MHDLGKVVYEDDAESIKDAIKLAKDLIVQFDAYVIDFEISEIDEKIKVNGFYDDESQSMHYATIEKTEDLTIDEIEQWFQDEEYDLNDFSLNDVINGWDSY